MGEDISSHNFAARDYTDFEQRLRQETAELCERIDAGWFGDGELSCGHELEGWLIDAHYRATAANDRFLSALSMPETVAELARFNVEFNGRPKEVSGHGLAAMHAELLRWLNRGAEVAESQGLKLAFIGVLPTLTEADVNLCNITMTNRYKALNTAIAAHRGDADAEIHIQGPSQAYRRHFDSIMIESATTSFQLHLQVPASESLRWYNAAVAATAPVLALAANSPFLFGHELWAESRVPVFMQSVNSKRLESVTFGHGYLQHSWSELFRNNLEYPVLLPERFDAADQSMPHLRLHNSTVWRWNRPIIDLENRRLRLEHRALPSGPTVVDMVANCALFFGLVAEWAASEQPISELLPFDQAEKNFYAAARDGIDARLHWRGALHDAPGLVLDELLATAARGLQRLQVDKYEADEYLDIIHERASRRTNGAHWQQSFVRRNGGDMEAMMRSYCEQQLHGRPVAQWPI